MGLIIGGSLGFRLISQPSPNREYSMTTRGSVDPLPASYTTPGDTFFSQLRS
jgi:hypothetical protein